MLGLSRTAVELYPHEKEWDDAFQSEKEFLSNFLKGNFVAIEHVGSTSIDGLMAKPIIDIALGVKNNQELKNLFPILQQAGYEVVDEIDLKGQILAKKGSEECRTHYIHACVYGGDRWNTYILFKKYLLAHPEYIKKYEDLKVDLKQNYERKQYTAHKNEFITEILAKAEAEFGKIKPIE